MQTSKFFLLLLSLAGLLSTWGTYAQNPCNLPAPTNIQFSQPNSTTVDVTWDPVPGAAAYWATFQNLSNSQQPIQVANPIAPSTTFGVIAGDYYLFRVAAQCLQPDGSLITSTNFAEKNYLAESVIVDVVVKMNNCIQPTRFPYGTIASGNSFVHADLDGGTHYVIKLLGGGLTLPEYEFYYSNTLGKFQLGNRVPSDPSVYTAGLAPDPNSPTWDPIYQPPPVLNASNIRVIQGSSIGFISFPTTESIHFEAIGFTHLEIYSCGGGASPGTNEGDDPIVTSSTDTPESAALRNILPLNPFATDLTLYFQEHPEQPITAHLFDVSGRSQVQQVIQPIQVSGNQYTLPTADLAPGMYFLRLETAPGVFSTHKVVKYGER